MTSVRGNHIGDWGTPFGMLIEHLLDIGDAEATQELSVGDLDAFYKAARAKFDDDDVFSERARRRVVALQSGDADYARCLASARATCPRSTSSPSTSGSACVLGRHDFAGESTYNDQLPRRARRAGAIGTPARSDGARCVFPHGFSNRAGEPLPLIVQKSDGGFGYAATDLAALRYRTRQHGATRLLYVVGLPQQQHLEMVFQVAREAGWLTGPARAQHVASAPCWVPMARFCAAVPAARSS